MPGLIVKPRKRYLKSELKRQKVPPGRVCRGDPIHQCRKKPLRRMPGGLRDEFVCLMHYWRYRRFGGNFATRKEYEAAMERKRQMKLQSRENEK